MATQSFTSLSNSIENLRIKFPYSYNCIELQKTIDKLINERSYNALKMSSSSLLAFDKRLKELESFFESKNCPLIIGNLKLEQVGEVISKYNEIDKIRIEAESDAEVKKRILVGVSIVLAGVGIILIANRK